MSFRELMDTPTDRTAVTPPLLSLALNGVDIILFRGACRLQALSKLQIQGRPSETCKRSIH